MSCVYEREEERERQQLDELTYSPSLLSVMKDEIPLIKETLDVLIEGAHELVLTPFLPVQQAC